MRRIVGALALAVFASGPASASDEADVMAVVHQFGDALVRTDAKAVASTCVDEASIIDNIQPYHWNGPGVCARWYSDYDTNNKSYQFVLQRILFDKPLHLDVSGDRAYVVVSNDLHFTVSGHPMMDGGSLLTFALSKSASGWRIGSWTWSDGVVMAEKDASTIRKAFTSFALALFSPRSASAADKRDVMQTVNQFANAIVRDDMRSVAATCADEASIIDNIPPYRWGGTGACTRWASDYEADIKAHQYALGRITLDEPLHLDVSGDHAYVVVSSKLDFAMQGQAMTDSGSVLTFALSRTASGWRINAWTWSDGRVTPAEAAVHSS